MKSLGPHGAAGFPSDKLKLRSGGSSPLPLKHGTESDLDRARFGGLQHRA